MEPQDQDYEHCGGCACLSECGCSCPECLGAVRTMIEVRHGEGCGCGDGSESLVAERDRYKAALEKIIEHHKTIVMDPYPGDRCEHPWFEIAKNALDSNE